MYPAYKIVQNALKWYYQRDNIAYFMGAKGEVLTDARMKELHDAYYEDYFKKYDPATMQRIYDWSRGKIGFDCSGFVSKCVGVSGWSSWSLWDKCRNATSVAECKAGSLLWRPEHIGIDIGYGATIHIGAEMRTIEIVPNTDPGPAYQKGGEWYDADYSMMTNH